LARDGVVRPSKRTTPPERNMIARRRWYFHGRLPQNASNGELTTFKESVSVINITSLTILSASLFRLSPSFSRRLYHADVRSYMRIRAKHCYKSPMRSEGMTTGSAVVRSCGAKTNSVIGPSPLTVFDTREAQFVHVNCNAENCISGDRKMSVAQWKKEAKRLVKLANPKGRRSARHVGFDRDRYLAIKPLGQ
jgi:hypothetical protein